MGDIVDDLLAEAKMADGADCDAWAEQFRLAANEIERLRAELKKEKDNMVTGKQIVILDRGFVYVGDVEIDGDWMIISNAQNVRVWGTTKGLGELAECGPTAKTVLDPAGTLRAPLRAVIGCLETEGSKWTA